MRKSTLSLACAAALVASSLAVAQTIPAPAGSTDSGVRARVAITPVDTSNLATKTEVSNAYNSSINWTETRYSQAVNYAASVSSRPSYGTVMRTGVGQVNMSGAHVTTRVLCMYGSFSQPYFGVIERNPCAGGETFVPVGSLYIDSPQGY